MSRLKGVSAVLALLILGLFAYGCGGNDEVTQEDVDDAIQRVEEKQQLRELQRQVKQLQDKAADGTGSNRDSNGAGQGDGYYEDGSGSGGPVSNCGAGVRVGPNTSCAFAMNVAGEYGSNPGATSIGAYSPVTGEQYTLSCGPWTGGGTVCSGGNGAAVYLP